MSIFSSLFGKSPNPIRETLFGDVPVEQFPGEAWISEEYPWNVFRQARAHISAGKRDDAIACWREIVSHPALESREYLQAWHFLRQHGQQPPPATAKQILGVVVEAGLHQGLDLLAAYADHSARYYNYSGAGIIWEHPDDSIDAIIDQLLMAGKEVVAQIGPWDKARPAAPSRDHARISYLTPSGLHLGEGPFVALSRDSLSGPVLHVAINLMRELMAKTKATQGLQ